MIWKYTGDKSSEKEKEAETNINRAYNLIFSKAMKNLIEKKKSGL